MLEINESSGSGGGGGAGDSGGYCDDLVDDYYNCSDYGSVYSAYPETINTSNTMSKKKKDMVENRKITKIHVKLKTGVKTTITLFNTNYYPGVSIKSAMTGVSNRNHKVGTLDEYLYFKVVNSIANKYQEPDILYFDDPGQYEKCLNVKCPDKIKEDWTIRYNEYLLSKRIEEKEHTDNKVLISNQIQDFNVVSQPKSKWYGWGSSN